MSWLLGSFGVWLSSRYGDDAARAAWAVEAEELGYGTVWLGAGADPTGVLALSREVLDRTSRVVVATSVISMWRASATAVAVRYREVAADHPDRFLLGVGLGHREGEQRYRKPYETMVAYLDELDGEGVPATARILGALGPRALALAAERTAGANPYLTGPAHTARARDILGPAPLLAPEQKVVIDPDPTSARAVGRPGSTDPYLRLTSYRTNLLRSGFSAEDLADGGSDRLVDTLALHGDAPTVAVGLRAHLDAGADSVGIQVLSRPGDDPMPGYRALAETLF